MTSMEVQTSFGTVPELETSFGVRRNGVWSGPNRARIIMAREKEVRSWTVQKWRDCGSRHTTAIARAGTGSSEIVVY